MTMKEDIQSRSDIHRMVRAFYTAVKADELIGPVFQQVIQDWEEHFELLTDFWETNLFFKALYKGRPHQAHIAVDRQTGGVITQEYFGRWLELWFRTIDELFEGPHAETAKYRARNMSTMMFMKIWQARQPGNKHLL